MLNRSKNILCLWMMWFAGFTAAAATAQDFASPRALSDSAASPLADSNSFLCPIEWVGEIAALELDPLSLYRISNRQPMSFPRGNTAEFQTDVLASVFLKDPYDLSPAEVVLVGLFGDGSRLEGAYVRAGSEKIDGLSESARSQNGHFRFQPDLSSAGECITNVSACSPFDAVNVYYHIDQFARRFWVEKMGVNIGFQADAKVHVSGDGAFAATEGNVLKFRVGDIFMKNAALSDDIIYHEYAHLVAASFDFNPTSDHGAQTRAMAEGYADYFTATYTNDPRIGEWLVTCPDRQNCVGPPNDTEIRTLDLDVETWNWKFGFPSTELEYGFCLRYHEGDGKCKASYNNFANHYTWGMIWAATMWDMRKILGAEVVDQLALTALQLHDTQSKFLEGSRDWIEADHQLFSGQHVPEMMQVFRNRGFGIPTIESTEQPSTTSLNNLQVWPNPASKHVSLSFDSSDLSAITISWLNLLGQVVEKVSHRPQHIGTQVVQMPIESVIAGTYLVVISSENEPIARKIVTVQ